MSRLIVVGAGGFGRESLDVIADQLPDRQVVVVDDSPRDQDLKQLSRAGIPFLGSLESWSSTRDETDEYIIGIGDPRTRHAVDSRLRGQARPSRALVHSTATIGNLTYLAPGTIVCTGARVSTNVSIGAHCHVNPGAIVGHDSTLGAFVSLNPGSIVSGAVCIDDRALIGAGSVLLQGLRIGGGSTIGAAACVTKDVGDGAIVKGVPAK